jgi:uncharacterized protein (TIGR02145 family)
MKKSLWIILALFNLSVNAQEMGSFTDSRDGRQYKTIKIGTQTWMAENLKALKFTDGTAIQIINSATIWSKMTTPAYCLHGNKPQSWESMGILYNYYTVETNRLCPIGWHVPAESEWESLIEYLGGKNIAGSKMRIPGKPGFWKGSQDGITNESGFSSIGGALRLENGVYGSIGIGEYWWTSTAKDADKAVSYILSYNVNGIMKSNNNKKTGAYIRCLKD